MKRPKQTELLRALVDMSGMAFAAKAPEDALQSLADALDVQTVAIGRVDKASGRTNILAQNPGGSVTAIDWSGTSGSVNSYVAVLVETTQHRDVLLLQTRLSEISQNQRSAIDIHFPFLATLWESRSDSFERLVSMGRTPAIQSVLHPDNPYNLTATEMRVCGMIGAGQRPTMMARTMKTSMPTVRTHLRNIYMKTGLDGMIGVMQNLHAGAGDEKIAS